MAKAKKVPNRIEGTADGFVDDAFSDAEGLTEELQSWYDNLPESFQNGERGEKLQEAIDALESASKPDVPDALETVLCFYTPSTKRKQSRRDRLDECVTRIEEAKSAAETVIADLENLHYNDEGKLVDDDDAVMTEEAAGDDPMTEEERDNRKSDLETFVSDCDEVVDAWNGVEFPGMYG